ncbi:hypothetical protein NPIL_189771 [Nephila pilipes]|uniref:Uncharacterized protein n=1 Tax=Nephila pilipes TaxID=299642 RepID=A0A8X6PMB0_NEPPI|nr:hypothetical protein NPIL_189771 [Nephila pilipes]
MSTSIMLKNRKAAYDRVQIRKWILVAVTNFKSRAGVTIHHIRKFLDAKRNGLSTKPETQLILKRLLDSGYLLKKEGKYIRSRKKPRSFAKKQRSASKRAIRNNYKNKYGLKKGKRINTRKFSKSRHLNPFKA